MTEYEFQRQEPVLPGEGQDECKGFIQIYTAAVTETVAPRNILTERRPYAERAPVRRTVKITSEPDTLREMG